MVVLDSDHTDQNVIQEMETYGPLVTPGYYMVVCDSNLGGNPIHNAVVKGPGPMKAIMRFMASNTDFEMDMARSEKFYMTFFPNGWLKKKVK